MTHAELVQKAVKWLTSTMHCGVVLSELKAYTPGNEIPDAIGWQGCKSIVVECKASRADFLANDNKSSARADILMGSERYFFCRANLIKAEEVLDPYGLLWIHDIGEQIRIKKHALIRTERRSTEGEIAMLVSALRRVRTREFLTIVREGEE